MRTGSFCLSRGCAQGSRLAPLATKLALLLLCTGKSQPTRTKSHRVRFSLNKRITNPHCCPGTGRLIQRSVRKTRFSIGCKKQRFVVCQVMHDSMAEALQLGNVLTTGLENAPWLSQSNCPSQFQQEIQVGRWELKRGAVYAWWQCHFQSLVLLWQDSDLDPPTPQSDLLLLLAHWKNKARCFHQSSCGLWRGFACSALLLAAHRIPSLNNCLIQSCWGHIRFSVLLHATLWLTV